jgi:hypothetical protein
VARSDDIESRNLLLGAGGDAMKPDLSRVTLSRQRRRLVDEVHRARRQG